MKRYFTKMLTVCCAIVFGAFFTTDAQAQGDCLNTIQWPSSAVDMSAAGSDLTTISTCNYREEFSVITGVPAGEDIEFTLPGGGYVTVREDSSGGPIVAQGSGSATVIAASGADLYPHWSVDATCATETGTCVVTTLECTSCPDDCPNGNIGDPCDDGDADTTDDTIGEDCVCAGIPVDCPGLGNIGDACDDGDPNTLGDVVGEDCTCAGTPITGDCLNTESFGDADLSTASNELILISGCSYQTEYATITGVPVGEDIEFSIVEGGYITVRSDSADGAVVAQGTSPVTVSGASGSDLYAHWNTDAACNTAEVCVDTQVQCTTCGTDCPDGNIGDPCDDGDPLTEGETLQEDCSCGGGVVVPANDICDSATTLECGDTIEATTEGASGEDVAPSGCGFSYQGSPTVWYAFEANGSDNYTVTLDPGADALAWDGVLYVYSGACGELTEVGCSDSTITNGSEAVELIAPAAGIYYVLAQDYTGFDTFSISLDCETDCTNPFPAVDEESISTTFEGNSYLVEWGAVEGQIGCQLQLRLAGASEAITKTIVLGEDASSQVIPGGILDFATDYEWRVRCGCSIDPNVVGPYSSWQAFTTPGSAITSLPNPTEGQSTVTFTVVEEGYTTLEVFDMSGRLVDAVFTGNTQPNNEYRFEFDGSALPNGVYLYRLTTESEVLNNKFMIAK